MNKKDFWFVVGTQHLYGETIFKTVENHAKEIVDFFNKELGLAGGTSKTGAKEAGTNAFSIQIIFKGLLKTAEDVTLLFKQANNDDTCLGIITWMHTFSPSKMWIRGLQLAQKPILHLHTQFNKEIPWDTIDMDFMNLNQSAHGDREHGHIYAKLRKTRKVVSGYYKDARVSHKLQNWIKTALGIHESLHLNVVRFGDNMRNVAVTEGDKVAAEIQFGWSVNGYGVGDLIKILKQVKAQDINAQMEVYKNFYSINTKDIVSVEYQAKVQVAIKQFLTMKNAQVFTTTFEDLHGLEQLPGLACQDLMRQGYGFGAEGDWKTASMLRIIKMMSSSLSNSFGHCSFMEDYTYHLPQNQETVLGAHMLEICPSIAVDSPKNKPIIDVHPLGIGGKNPPARAIFDAKTGPALQTTLIDLGNRFRMIVAECEAIAPLKPMPKLPVARAMWKLHPNFEIGTEAWIIAGGAHHTVMSYDLDIDVIKDFAEFMDIEVVHISKHTQLAELKNNLMIGELYYKK